MNLKSFVLLSILATTHVATGYGQAKYTFSMSTGDYRDLDNAISINGNEDWVDLYYVVPIGFSFELYGTSIDSLYFGKGYGGTVSSKINSFNAADYTILIFETRLADRGYFQDVSISPISYKLEGPIGSRIFKLEFRNAGFFNEAVVNSTLHDYIDFQLWLYEGTNDIEMHFGPSKITDPDVNYDPKSGPFIGLDEKTRINSCFLSGNPDDPVVQSSVAALEGTPSNGTIYRFSKSTTGVKSNPPNPIISEVYPNPAQNSAIIEIYATSLRNAELRISDINGRAVKVIKNLEGTKINIDRTGLKDGIYFYTILEENTPITRGKIMFE